MDQNPKQQVVERIKAATNILVTVSTNPSVDQLAACIGFTLMLNKLGKHATAVFSGKVPSTIEFLQPEQTLETTTDSLRDFIIALDKSKADKLRYKVEDEVVRIFITPYRTSIGQKDLEFSQGDYNVDVVVALGVTQKEDIDKAIIMHGRILHDAAVMAVTIGETPSAAGSINWHEPTASSLSEMLVSISESFQSGLLDPQMSTAFLTGIVAQTDRFSNEKTTPKVMTMSAQLMAAGANQQLIATKLAPPPEPLQLHTPPPLAPDASATLEPEPEPPKPDGEIDINHVEEEPVDEDEINIDDQGNLQRQAELEEARKEAEEKAKKAEEQAENQDDLATVTEPAMDLPAPMPSPEPYPQESQAEPPVSLTPPSFPTPRDDETLAQLEVETGSPHTTAYVDTVDDARQAVDVASLEIPPRPAARESLGAQYIDIDTPPGGAVAPQSTMDGVTDIVKSSAEEHNHNEQPAPTVVEPEHQTPAPEVVDPLSPPPVPPPMTMPYFEPQTSHHNPYLNPSEKPADTTTDQSTV